MAFWNSNMLLLPIASFLLFFFFFILTRSQRWSRKLPVNWPILGMLPAIVAEYNNLFVYAVEALRECGGTFELKLLWGAEYLVTCDPANANHVFNTNFADYGKGDLLELAEVVLGRGILTADGESWQIQRKLGHALMGDPRFRLSVAEFSRDKAARALLPFLDRAAELGIQVDLHDIFLRFTLDNACKLFVGKDYGCLSPGLPAVPLAMALDEAEQGLIFRNIMPNVCWKLLGWLRVGQERRTAEAAVVVQRFLDQCISERRAEEKSTGPSSPFPLDNLLKSYREHCPRGPEDDYFRSHKFLRDCVITFLAGGTDTTGSALSWFTWLVATHPSVEKKIIEELRGVRASSDEMVVFEAEEVESLVYLHAVVCEALRLFPTIPCDHKVAAKDDVLPTGHRVRAGTKVLVPMYAMGRMEKIWGEDCLEFKPERWISDKGELRHEPSYKFLAFGSGPRTCLGKSMALTEMKVAAAAVMYNFHVRVVDGHVVEPKLAVVLRMKHGLMVRVKRRRAAGDATTMQ